MSSGNIVKLNVGGTVFQTTRSTLTKFNGRLKDMLLSGTTLDKDESGAIFIDRSPKHFDRILNYLRDGHVTLPECEKEREEFKMEAVFYGLTMLVNDWSRDFSVEQRFVRSYTDVVGRIAMSTKKHVAVISCPLELNFDGAIEASQILNACGNKVEIFFKPSNAVTKNEKWTYEIHNKATKKTYAYSASNIAKSIKNHLAQDP